MSRILETRAVLLAGLFVAIGATRGIAQQTIEDPLRGLPASAESWQKISRGRWLTAWLRQELQAHFHKRRQRVAAVRDRAQAEAWRDSKRATFRRLVGSLPKQTPLRTRVVGTVRRDRYRIEKLIYESFPGIHVTANLYVPDVASAQHKVPGVLIACGHAQNAKASRLYQAAAAGLAHHGIAALLFDPIGQGERMQLLDARGKHRVWGTKEHTMLGMRARLMGTSTAAFMLHDAVRSLDVLAGRPEVDADKLGCTGNSGGGTQTSLLMAFEERVAAAAPGCYITSLEKLFATIGPQDDEQNLPGQVRAGFEHADFITARMPKPTLILAATRDFFSIDGTWDTFREVKRLYGLLGLGDRVGLFEFDDGHGHSKPRRTAALRFFLRWLAGRDEPTLEEPELRLCTDDELRCTESGQVLSSIAGARSLFDVLRERSTREVVRPERSREAMARVVSAVTGLPGSGGASELGPTVDGRSWITVDGFPLSVRRHAALGKAKTAIVVCEDPDLRLGEAELEALRRRGHVFVVDVRGFGMSAVAKNRKYGGQLWREFDAAYYAMHLGTSLPVLRARDLMRWFDVIASMFAEGSRIEVYATGRSCVPALHAALFRERCARVTLRGGLRSWRALFDAPFAPKQLGSIVPGALLQYDLPDLVAALGEGRVSILEPLRVERWR